MALDDYPKRFGDVVRDFRRSQGVSQERLAALAGIDRAYMGGLERGKRNPSLTTVARVANGLGMTMSELFAAIEHDGAEPGSAPSEPSPPRSRGRQGRPGV